MEVEMDTTRENLNALQIAHEIYHAGLGLHDPRGVTRWDEGRQRHVPLPYDHPTQVVARRKVEARAAGCIQRYAAAPRPKHEAFARILTATDELVRVILYVMNPRTLANPYAGTSEEDAPLIAALDFWSETPRPRTVVLQRTTVEVATVLVLDATDEHDAESAALDLDPADLEWGPVLSRFGNPEEPEIEVVDGGGELHFDEEMSDGPLVEVVLPVPRRRNGERGGRLVTS